MNVREFLDKVTILILIDGFLQYEKIDILTYYFYQSHNPYFNRWFSAMKSSITSYV